MTSLLPILTMPRRLLDMDNWFSTTLDIFDPFDELDQEICRNLIWLRKPVFSTQTRKAKVPSKYRLDINCQGYKPESLNTEIKDEKLVLQGHDEVREQEDYTKKEFRKSFKLPPNIDADKMVSFMTKKGHMIVEIPYKAVASKSKQKAKAESEESYIPAITKNLDGSEKVTFSVNVSHFDLSKLQVTLKDLDVIISCEEPQTGEEAKITNIRKFRLPDNTDLGSLTCFCDKGELKFEANLIPESETLKKIPIQFAEEKAEELKSEEKPKEQQPQLEEYIPSESRAEALKPEESQKRKEEKSFESQESRIQQVAQEQKAI